MLLVWIAVFVVALAVLVKGSDFLLNSAEKIGIALGFSPFIVGVVIIGFGTSLPELASSLAGVLGGANELVAANVIGSNIANILLIVGFAAMVAGRLVVDKNLVDLDIPMLAFATAFMAAISYDGLITRGESVFALLAFAVYLFYTFRHKEEKQERGAHIIETFDEAHGNVHGKNALSARDIALLVLGLGMLILGARYVVTAVLELSAIVGIGVGIISLVAVAAGTSLPELVVAIRAGLQGKADVSLGNIFGSNVFNIFMVIGLPGLIAPLVVDPQTLMIGLPVMVGTTLLFLISSLSNRVYNYEGAMYALFYVFFLVKLAGVV